MANEPSTVNPQRIGDFLVSIGAMKQEQVTHIVRAQQGGDTRIFGEIAIAMGYIDEAALQRYVESRA